MHVDMMAMRFVLYGCLIDQHGVINFVHVAHAHGITDSIERGRSKNKVILSRACPPRLFYHPAPHTRAPLLQESTYKLHVKSDTKSLISFLITNSKSLIRLKNVEFISTMVSKPRVNHISVCFDEIF